VSKNRVVSANRVRHVLNVRGLITFLVLCAVVGLGGYALWRFQEKKVLAEGFETVKKFQKLAREEKDPGLRGQNRDLALRHLVQYLQYRPDDTEALELEAHLLLESGDILAAASVYEHLLRFQESGPKAQDARRKLAEIYIIYSDQYRNSQMAKDQPEYIARELRYHAAELRAQQLVYEAKPPADDADAHRLLAMALEGQVTSGQRTREINGVQKVVDLADDAIKEYEIAFKKNPADPLTAERLANLYLKNKKSTADAERVLDGLLAAAPDSLRTRQVRHDYFKSRGDIKAAKNELDEAYRKHPEDLWVILTAGYDALQDKDTKSAREWIDRAAEKDKGDLRLLTLKGSIDYLDRNPMEAVDTWSKGLSASEGSDVNLVRQLAMVKLELNQDQEAKALVEQYRRLAGDHDPVLRFLEAIQDEHARRYPRAVEGLESVAKRLTGANEAYLPMVRRARARCLEKQGSLVMATDAYREAILSEPTALDVRYQLARLLLQQGEFDQAQDALEKALAIDPKQPELLVLLAQAALQQQLARPPQRRNWAAFDATYARAAAAAPNNPRLVLIGSDRVTASGEKAKAVDGLRAALAKDPASLELALALAAVLVSQGDHAGALKVLQDAPESTRPGATGLLRSKRADVMMILGQGRAARAMLMQGVDRLSRTDQDIIWNGLVRLCKLQGDRATSAAAYNDWAKLFPDDLRPRLMELELAIESGKPEAVTERLESLRPGKDQDDTLWQLAQARERLYRRSTVEDTPANAKTREALLDEAEKLVQAVLGETNTDPTALMLDGFVCQERNTPAKLEEAVKKYESAIKYGSAEALPYLVDVLVRTGKKEELAKLRAGDSTTLVQQIEAASLLRHGMKDEANRLVDQSLHAPSGAQPWQLGMLDRLGDEKKVVEGLRDLAARNPDRIDIWLALVRHLATHGATGAANDTIAEIRRRGKVEPPELLEAQCRWAAADWPAAEKAFDQAVKRHPEVQAVQAMAANYYEDRGNHPAAEACLRRILAKDPKDRSSARQLALVLTSQGNRPEVIKEAMSLVGAEDSPDDTPQDRLARGLVLTRSGDPESQKRAITVLRSLLADVAAESLVATTTRDTLTRLLIAAGQPEEAARVAEVSASSGTNVDAIALYAETLLRSRNYPALEEQLKRLETTSQGRTYEARLRVRMIGQREEPSGVAPALEKAFLALADAPIAEAFGREAYPFLVQMGAEGLAVAERIGRRLAEKDPALSWMVARVMLVRGKYAEAMALDQAVIQSKAGPGDLTEAGRVAIEATLRAPADSALRQRADELLGAAASRAPTNDGLLLMRALICHLQGRYAEEVQIYRTILGRQPRDFVALNNIAWALSEGLNQPSEALEMIDGLLKIAGRNPEYLDTRGVVLMRLGRLEEATADLEEAARREPNGTHVYHLALAYKKLGREDDFRKKLDEARKAGLTPETIDPFERKEFETLINL
jgi:tetratricopeptide (TPR) repeat protein